jgi:dTDP-glucose pyrophosphorylase
MNVPVAVILAGGLGTRLRAAGAALDAPTEAIAATGIKALLPDATGRPFLDHVLTDIADAGISEVVLVIGPDHDALRQAYSGPMRRLRMRFAVQASPRGTADALAAAAAVVGERDCIVINSDNRYPVAALQALVAHPGPALIGFERAGLLTGGLPAERLNAFAVIDVADGEMKGILEKPSAAELAARGDQAYLSLNCWRFDQRIFAACAATQPSVRGELELPAAVALSRAAGCRYRVIPHAGQVLDLSRRDDVAGVRTALAGHVVDL